VFGVGFVCGGIAEFVCFFGVCVLCVVLGGGGWVGFDRLRVGGGPIKLGCFGGVCVSVGAFGGGGDCFFLLVGGFLCCQSCGFRAGAMGFVWWGGIFSKEGRGKSRWEKMGWVEGGGSARRRGWTRARAMPPTRQGGQGKSLGKKRRHGD